ncbi:hypothetical protein B0H17DRAFT_1206409 [Mycena rosella]|uniref:Uncharacterized protein n=1 Tax=Mycena rosella TaxID=1033263 RepID=A0AAD7D563_MYCRO|nr:hypothetical protein B0H17DRAFT_1206409 [Mycena rosella]
MRPRSPLDGGVMCPVGVAGMTIAARLPPSPAAGEPFAWDAPLIYARAQVVVRAGKRSRSFPQRIGPDFRALRAYAGWVIKQLQRYPTAFVELHRTKGTAAVREHFLSEFKRSEEGTTPVYVRWVIRQIEGETAAFVECCRNEGIAGCRSASPHVSHGVDL